MYLRGNGEIWIYKGGVFQGNFGNYLGGDSIRIERLSDSLLFYHNGILLHTIQTNPFEDLRADIAILNLNSGFCQTTYSAESAPGSGDNLGNHCASQNIKLNGNWLSPDSTNRGIYIDTQAFVGIGTPTPIVELQVAGAVNIGSTQSKHEGTIRYENGDFEGYTGVSWQSMTEDSDADPANELISSLELNGFDLNIEDAGGERTVDLSPAINSPFTNLVPP